MVNKITTPPTQNEVIDKINELVDDKQDTISDLATIRSGATGNVKLDGGSATQTVSLTSGTGTTALGVKSKSTSSYISFSGSSGWLASFGILNTKKPTIYDGTSHEIAYTTDIPTNNNQLTNGAGYITSSALTPYALSADLATVATTGSYNDLSNKPTIPTVNNATLTIQKNGSNVATFTANASSNVTANISVPTVDQTYSATSANAQSGVAVASAIGNGSVTINQGGTPRGTFTMNQNSNLTIDLDGTSGVSAIAILNKNTASPYQTLGIWQGTESQWTNGGLKTWYYWQTSLTAVWTASTLPSSASWQSVTYGDGKFVAVADSSKKVAYSTDGINWTASTMPSSAGWQSVTYGDGKFVAVDYIYNKSAYSTDGINWTASTLPSSASWQSVTYGDGKFIAVANGSDKSAYSTDGINWTATTLPSSDAWESVTYGDGKFVAVATAASSKSAYSTDGINWIASTLPSSARWNSVTYGDGKFVAVSSYSNKLAYSTDGINWTASTLPSSVAWWSVTYGDGKFVAVAYSSDKSAYSTDGINWTASTMPSSANWWSVTYGDGKFVAVAQYSDKLAILTITYDKCYTTDQNPTTTSVVYSEPEIVSSYTISSVTSGAITLSNNNTYYYNQSGNAYTYQTIGDAHPEYLCFIDGVGVKMGNTTIATNNSNS